MERTAQAVVSRFPRWWVALLPAAIAGVIWAASTADTANAQETAAVAPAAGGYKVLPLNPELLDRKNFGPMKLTKDNILRDESGREWDDATKQNMFKSYYSRYLLPAMTQPDRAGDLSALRQELVEATQKAANASAREWLKQVALAAGSNFVKDNYSPAVKINGALLLGELDDRSPDFLNKVPPTPAAAALPVLLEAYSAADAGDGLQAAALVGILRHARFNSARWPEADQQRVFDLAKSLVTADPPANRDPKAHAWLQARGAEILVSIPGEPRQAEAYALLAGLAAGKSDPLARYRAVGLMGTLGIPAAPTVDADQLAISWSKLLLTSMESTFQSLADFREAKPSVPGMNSGTFNPFAGGGYNPFGSGGGPPGPPPGAGGGFGNPYGGGSFNPYGRNRDDKDKKKKEEEPPVDQPDEVVIARRAMNSQLEQLLVGLTGKRSPTERGTPAGGLDKLAAAEPAKGRVAELLTLISDTQAAINVPTLKTRDELMAALEGRIAALRTFVTLAEPPQATEGEETAANTEGAAAGTELTGFASGGQ